ncbi:trypsin inhibitor ClTI-1-like [Brachyhypopomus gauderio]|uniref:trypsin inhibitor ClTI-1-like n=1 Tax=Brachyhypopomus gauderio TaxID=698409 RepID=UPI0040420786
MKLAIVLCASVLVYFAGVTVTLDCPGSERPAAEVQPDCTPYDNVKDCPTDFVPCCGTCGNTHANLCVFCKYIKQVPDIKFAKNGTCQSS